MEKAVRGAGDEKRGAVIVIDGWGLVVKKEAEQRITATTTVGMIYEYAATVCGGLPDPAAFRAGAIMGQVLSFVC